MSVLALDTHAALWWSFFPEKLSKTAASALEDAEQLLIPAIVFWETSLLVCRKHIELPVSPVGWLRGLGTAARVSIAPLTATIALRADRLRMHEDPADRFIVATALARNAALVTKDTAITGTKLVRTVW